MLIVGITFGADQGLTQPANQNKSRRRIAVQSELGMATAAAHSDSRANAYLALRTANQNFPDHTSHLRVFLAPRARAVP
jgi:hypothetical protein